MSKYLVIVESPNKVKKIRSFLGKDYDVTASVGHIRDLPPKKIGVNIKNDFEPTYETYPDKKDVVKTIKKMATGKEMVYIATDLDREGEGIAKHIADILPSGVPYCRMVYGSVTKASVLDGLANAGDINHHMVDSYETRRILDRLVGWKCSFITTQATGGKSAGRVQSATLRILAEREKDIQNFVPQEYWAIDAVLEKSNGERVSTSIKKPNKLKIKTKEEADKICEIFRTKPILVSKYETKEVRTKPYAPFTTSTLYQSGASILNWSSDKTSVVAQKLYEDGLCTYIRSDSTFIVPEVITCMREAIPGRFGADYLPSTTHSYSNKANAQEAHEAIRVTDIQLENTTGTDTRRLYELVWKRTMASQMEKMAQRRGSADFDCENYVLTASGSKVTFDGWYKVWNYGSFDDSELPELEVGEEMKLISIQSEQKFTQPPPRYSEQTLIKEIEKRGIGRPSTYKNIIKTLVDRKYIEKKSKAIHVTVMGVGVSDFLVASNFCFVDISFTENMETDLDCIARGDCEKLDILTNFWTRLSCDLNHAKEVKNSMSETDYPCPKCEEKGREGKLILKNSKYGKFYGCSNRKEFECDYKADVGKSGEPVEKVVAELEYSEEFDCPNCGLPYIIRTSKKGWQSLGCRNWKDQDCAGFFSIETGEKIVFGKKKFKKWKK